MRGPFAQCNPGPSPFIPGARKGPALGVNLARGLRWALLLSHGGPRRPVIPDNDFLLGDDLDVAGMCCQPSGCLPDLLSDSRVRHLSGDLAYWWPSPPPRCFAALSGPFCGFLHGLLVHGRHLRQPGPVSGAHDALRSGCSASMSCPSIHASIVSRSVSSTWLSRSTCVALNFGASWMTSTNSVR